MGFFSRKSEGQDASSKGGDTARASRGWTETLEFLKSREGMRVLDFGGTSSANINYLTQLGQSVYMANVVEDATKPEWTRTGENGKPEFDAERFAAQNFDFSGKEFDVILLWDTADYLPPATVPLLLSRLREVLRKDGRLLAFFHGKLTGPETQFYRYHVADRPELLLQPAGNFPVQSITQNRQVEKFLEGFSDTRFLLGKDNTREVIAVR